MVLLINFNCLRSVGTLTWTVDGGGGSRRWYALPPIEAGGAKRPGGGADRYDCPLPKSTTLAPNGSNASLERLLEKVWLILVEERWRDRESRWPRPK